MPGVTISTAVRTGAVNTGAAPAQTFFVVGQTARGIDSEAVLVTSLEDYENKFGGHATGHYTWYTLKTFFEEGGVQAYVARATAAAAVNASKALLAPASAGAAERAPDAVGAGGGRGGQPAMRPGLRRGADHPPAPVGHAPQADEQQARERIAVRQLLVLEESGFDVTGAHDASLR